jgi:hypothetical protein
MDLITPQHAFRNMDFFGMGTRPVEALLWIHEGFFFKANDVDQDIDMRKGGASCAGGHYGRLLH